MTVKKALVVYPAGGTKSNWAAQLAAQVPGPIYLDPKTHGLHDEDEYTSWDLTAVQMADVIFAYLEKDNPSGYGLCVEVGYAAALGKTIIFVEDPGHEKSRYFGMVRACATYAFNGVGGYDAAIEHLHMLVNAKQPHLHLA